MNKIMLILIALITLNLIVSPVNAKVIDFKETYQDYQGNWHQYTNENLVNHPLYTISETDTDRLFTTLGNTVFIPKTMDVTLTLTKVSPSKTYPKTVLIANMINVPTVVIFDGVTYPANTLAYLVFPYSLSRVKDYADDHNIRLGRWNFNTDIIIYDDNATVNYLNQSAYNFRIVGDEIRLYFVKTEANKLLGNITFQMNSWTISNATTAGWTTANISLNGSRWTNDGTLAINLRNDSSLNMSGLVAYWSFDEMTGTVIHQVNTESGLINTTNQGTWYGNTTLNYSTGKIGNAGLFDGVNDYVSIPQFHVPNTGVTFEFWFNTNSLTVGHIISKYNEYNIGIDSSGNLSATISDDSDPIQLQLYDTAVGHVRTQIAAGWHHGVVACGSGYCYLYVNGVQKDSSGWNGNSYSYSWGNSIGTSSVHSTSYPFNGTIDEVRIYNRALSTSEIAISYNTSMRVKAMPLILNQVAQSGYVVNQVRIVYSGQDTWNNISLDSRQNGTTDWQLISENLTSNSWYSIPNQYNSMDFRVSLNGNGSNTPFFTSLEWDEEATSALKFKSDLQNVSILIGNVTSLSDPCNSECSGMVCWFINVLCICMQPPLLYLLVFSILITVISLTASFMIRRGKSR